MIAQAYVASVVLGTMPSFGSSGSSSSSSSSSSASGAEPASFPFSIPKSYVAGSVGHLELRGVKGVDDTTGRSVSKTVFVTVDPNDLGRLVVIPKPGRSSTSIELLDACIEAAKSQAAERFAAGIPMTKCGKPMHPSLAGAVAYRDPKDPENWTIRSAGSSSPAVAWEQARHMSVTTSAVPSTAEVEGVVASIMAQYEGNFERVDVVNRALALMSHFRQVIAMPRVNRAGGSLDLAVTKVDGCVFALFRALSTLYPEALFLSTTSVFTFDVRSVPVMRKLRVCLLQSTGQVAAAATPSLGLPPLNDVHSRALYASQNSAVEDIVSSLGSPTSDVRGAYLWMTVGMGKSLVVINSISRLQIGEFVLWAV